jgi:hypothetical protein
VCCAIDGEQKEQEMAGMRDLLQSLMAELSTQPIVRRAHGGGQPRPGEDQPPPVPGRDIPIQEPEPDRLPDEEPNPNPDENREPPMQARSKGGENKGLRHPIDAETDPVP